WDSPQRLSSVRGMMTHSVKKEKLIVLMADFPFTQRLIIDVLIMADGAEDLLALEAILDPIVLDHALPELLRIVAVILGAAIDGEEGTDDAGEHMDIVHVLACVVDFLEPV